MKPYKEYNEGPEWMGKVPTHWEVKKTKYIYRMVCDFAPKDNGMELLSVYTHIGVRPRRTLEQKGNRASTTDGYWMVQKQDIIVNKLLAWMGAIGISKYDGVTSPAYDILRPLKDVHSDYYDLIFRSGMLLSEFKRRSRGIMDMRLRLYFDEFGQIPLPCPPLDEQKRIVGYLGVKNREIESYIAAKRSLLLRLKELSAAVISRTVTQGISPNVKTKASGIEWLGEMPEHWEVKKLAWCASLKSGDAITSVNINETGDYPVYGGNGFRGYTSSFTHEGHYALIGRQGALCGNINYASGKFFASEHAVVVTPRSFVVTGYLGELLRTMNLNQYSMTAAQPGLSVEAISKLKIPLPPLGEQNSILSFIENQLGTIREAQTRIEREIELARELWTTLVAEVVTGQIDVSDWDGVEEIVDFSPSLDIIEEEESELEADDELSKLEITEVEAEG